MNIILGALVADAASLGLHWIYDFPHLQRVAGENPEFKKPEAKNYEGVFSFYAHGMKDAGDFSHYGETLLVYLKSQISTRGARSFQSLYRDTFGYGGSFYGYIDNPTRITLTNLGNFELASVEEAKKMAKVLPDDIAKVVVQKVLPYNRKFSGKDLILPVTRAIQVTYSQPEVLETALAIAKSVDEKRRLDSGADDEQCPAWSTLSALCTLGISENEDDLLKYIEQVVRVTNNKDSAVALVQFAAKFLLQAEKTKSLEKSYDYAISKVSPELKALIEKGWNISSKNLEEVSATLGRTCYLKEALPLSLFILKNTKSYSEAIRLNILSGGDSCGRSMFLGAAAAALYGIGDKGIPPEYLLKLKRGSEVSASLV